MLLNWKSNPLGLLYLMFPWMNILTSLAKDILKSSQNYTCFSKCVLQQIQHHPAPGLTEMKAGVGKCLTWLPTKQANPILMPLACPFLADSLSSTAFPFCEHKKGETRRRNICSQRRCKISSQQEVQDLLTKGDTGSPHKRNVWSQRLYQLLSKGNEFYVCKYSLPIFCEHKKGETRRRNICSQRRCKISSQQEVQDLLTKGDTGSPHKRNVWSQRLYQLLSKGNEFYVCLQFLSLQPCSWPWQAAVGSCMQRIALKPVEKVCSLLWALQFLLRFCLTISLAWNSLTAQSSTPLVKLCLWKPARKERLMTLLLKWKPSRMLIQVKKANTPGCFGAIGCLLWLAPRLAWFIVAKLWWTEC